MENRGHFSLVDLAATLIGIIGLTVGVVLDVDARSMQSEISDIAESVNAFAVDQKNQDREIINTEENIIRIESFIGFNQSDAKGELSWRLTPLSK